MQEAQITQLKKETNTLNSRIQELNRVLFAKDHSLENGKIKSLQEKLQAKSRMSKQLETKIATLETEIAEARHKASTVDVTVGSLSEIISILKENKDKLYAQHLDELHQMDLLAQSEKQKLQNQIQEYQDKENHWKNDLSIKIEELNQKEEHLKQLAQNQTQSKEDTQHEIQKLNEQIDQLSVVLAQEQMKHHALLSEKDTWNNYAQELENDKVALEQSHAQVTALLANEQLNHTSLDNERTALKNYSENLKTQISTLEQNQEDLRQSLWDASFSANQLDENHSIAHVLQAYQLHDQLEQHKLVHASLNDDHANLQAALDGVLIQRQADQFTHNELQKNIQDLQSSLNKAYQIISTLHGRKDPATINSEKNEKIILGIASKASDAEFDRNAERLLSAMREDDIHQNFTALQNQYSQEQDRRKSVEGTISSLSTQADDRELEISEWIAEWEKRVLATETERDIALTKLQMNEQAQQELLDQLGQINLRYAGLETAIAEERDRHQIELTQLEEQLIQTQEEFAHAKLTLSLEKIQVLLEKHNIEQNYNQISSEHTQGQEALGNLEIEREEHLKNLALAESKQIELLNQIDAMGQKYAQIEEELKNRTNSSNTEESLVAQIQELEAMTVKLHEELAQERDSFNQQHGEAERQQAELARLFEEAKNKSDGLEKDLSELHSKHEEDLNSALNILQIERENALKNISEAELKQTELLKQLDDMGQKYAQIEEELKNRTVSSNNEDSLFAQIQELEAMTFKLHDELAQEKEQFNYQQNEAQKQHLELSRLLDEANQNSESLKKDLSDLHLRHDDELNSSLGNLEVERENALKNLEAAENRQQELLRQVEDLSNKYAHIENEYKNTLANQNNAEENFSNQIQELESIIVVLKNDLSSERDGLATYKANIEKQLVDISALSAEIKNLENERDEAFLQVASADKQQSMLVLQLEDLAQKYAKVEEQFQNHSQSAMQASIEFQQQLELLEDNSKRLEQDLNHEKQLSKVHFENFNSAISAVEDERDTAIQKHQTSEQDKTQMLGSLDDLRNKVLDLENQLTDQSARAQDVIQALENQLETTRATLDEMHSTLQGTGEDYSAKEKKFVDREKTYQTKIDAMEKELADMQKFIEEQKTDWNKLQKEFLKDFESQTSQ